MVDAVSAADASAHFLNSLDPDTAREERPVVERFTDAVGGERVMSEVTGDEVARFAQSLSPEAGDATHLEPLRAFLAYCSRLAFTDENLVPYLQLGPAAGGARGGEGASEELGGQGFRMTIEGLAALESELEGLKGRRPEIAAELRAAMEDKDFRENAPLDAARDQQGHLEAQIREIEHRLRHAVIVDADAKHGRANVGSTVKVLNLNASREQVYHLVSPTEVDPASGKISPESPVGRALLDHAPGEEVTVNAPSGPMRLRLLEVEG